MPNWLFMALPPLRNSIIRTNRFLLFPPGNTDKCEFKLNLISVCSPDFSFFVRMFTVEHLSRVASSFLIYLQKSKVQSSRTDKYSVKCLLWVVSLFLFSCERFRILSTEKHLGEIKGIWMKTTSVLIIINDRIGSYRFWTGSHFVLMTKWWCAGSGPGSIKSLTITASAKVHFHSQFLFLPLS